MLSRDCNGCEMQHMCSERYSRVRKDEKVYCPVGTETLLDKTDPPQFSRLLLVFLFWKSKMDYFQIMNTEFNGET